MRGREEGEPEGLGQAVHQIDEHVREDMLHAFENVQRDLPAGIGDPAEGRKSARRLGEEAHDAAPERRTPAMPVTLLRVR